IAGDPMAGRRWWANVPADLTPAVLQGLPAGQYTLVASGFEAGDDGSRRRTFWAREEIVTDGLTSTTVRLPLVPGAHVGGRVVFEGTSTPSFNVTVTLRPLPALDFPMDFSNQASTSAKFAIDGVMPGRFVIDAIDRSGSQRLQWTQKSVIAGGRDVTDLPI